MNNNTLEAVKKVSYGKMTNMYWTQIIIDTEVQGMKVQAQFSERKHTKHISFYPITTLPKKWKDLHWYVAYPDNRDGLYTIYIIYLKTNKQGKYIKQAKIVEEYVIEKNIHETIAEYDLFDKYNHI